jgi:hypothetical protein
MASTVLKIECAITATSRLAALREQLSRLDGQLDELLLQHRQQQQHEGAEGEGRGEPASPPEGPRGDPAAAAAAGLHRSWTAEEARAALQAMGPASAGSVTQMLRAAAAINAEHARAKRELEALGPFGSLALQAQQQQQQGQAQEKRLRACGDEELVAVLVGVGARLGPKAAGPELSGVAESVLAGRMAGLRADQLLRVRAHC